METKSKADNLHPALRVLANYSKAYPGAWTYADKVRAQTKNLPRNCLLPVHKWDPLVDKFGRTKLQSTTMQEYELTLLGGWRPRQDIVAVPPRLCEALFTTDIDQALSGDVFHRLPAWSVYFDLDAVNDILYGFFAGTARVYGSEDVAIFSLVPKPKEESFLNQRTLTFKICDLPLAKAMEAQPFFPKVPEEVRPYLELFMPLISITMFACVYGFDGLCAPGETRPASHPSPKRTKGSWRLFPPPKPAFHVLGPLLEKKLAEAEEHATGEDKTPGTHASPRAHLRRAHWHRFWLGSGASRRLVPRWIPPVPVNVGPFAEDEEAGMKEAS